MVYPTQFSPFTRCLGKLERFARNPNQNPKWLKLPLPSTCDYDFNRRFSQVSEMYGSDKVSEDAERTAFRKAEKKYKLYYDDSSKSSRKYLSLLAFVQFLLLFFISNVNTRCLTFRFNFTGKNNQNKLTCLRFWISSPF